MRDFRKLTVWQRAHQLTLDTYRLTAGFPRHEAYGLVAQMRRAAASVPTNIAEGAGRDTRSDYDRFLSYAAGSLNELEYQILLAVGLGYSTDAESGSLSDEVRQVRAMLTTLRHRVNPGTGTSA
jgi:four helix bundle protein